MNCPWRLERKLYCRRLASENWNPIFLWWAIRLIGEPTRRSRWCILISFSELIYLFLYWGSLRWVPHSVLTRTEPSIWHNHDRNARCRQIWRLAGWVWSAKITSWNWAQQENLLSWFANFVTVFTEIIVNVRAFYVLFVLILIATTFRLKWVLMC